MPRKGVHCTAVVRIDLDGLDAALQQEISDLFRCFEFIGAVDGPTIHCVINEQLFLGLSTEQLVDRESGGLSENVPLSNIDRSQHTCRGSTDGLIRDAVVDVLPQALDAGG